MKTEKATNEIREAIFIVRDITENREYLIYIEGIVDTLNHILEG